MRWFRLRQKWGTYLALTALVLQLVLASGHIHLDQAEAPAGDAAIAAVTDHPEAPITPAAPDQDHCAICALIHLAHTLVTPTAPTLPLPAGLERHSLIAAAAGPAAPHPTLFQARAPPLA